MQLINKNLKTLYSFLKKKKTDYYFVSTSDEFLNEYVPDYNMRLKWLTNFSGSNGYALISEKKIHRFLSRLNGMKLESGREIL